MFCRRWKEVFGSKALSIHRKAEMGIEDHVNNIHRYQAPWAARAWCLDDERRSAMQPPGRCFPVDISTRDISDAYRHSLIISGTYRSSSLIGLRNVISALMACSL